ncbi:kinase-like domain-containing protein [Rhizophagus irregularis DAOM 181602=DAOM 197198]|uniref:Kinase-like domain-containing protein n=1 Tax=Rhizophagus irregularis (strain DAOM 181602 / DAOM 197198 / MUCL 43194) TaxID=747089 RepID=A0A2P4QVK4_RHIID|nr:kinase-like domain-containing protein [Rhizophagus irregularis DAOM 181602=DAOM 197198]POG81693.1 kinase-like domain-containing protein [Rhizophagus irregularis DAOM 181602=DAOM 197198]|eukprot:XP_025188559.1 kinase-like domain-containing protein [Rhizophagus irregularis DAOM 181602=DAOM 197198]
MMVMEYAKDGNLRNVLSSDFNKILWVTKIRYLYFSAMDLKNLHELGYFHRDFHSGNILNISGASYISDFGLSGQLNEQNLDNKIYGVLPYIAPEVLNREPYTLSSDIYSFGVVMTELSSGKPPFHKRKHDISLALKICNGLRPEFGKGTPEIYKKLAHRCMNANPNQRPTANELYKILDIMKNMDIKEKKLKLYLKKLIKKYQIFQPHMKRSLMPFILVEHLHLKICQNPLIHLLLLLHILMKKIVKILN